MEPFEIEIHEVCTFGTYVHKIKLASNEYLHDSCKLLNTMLEQCEQYLLTNSQNLSQIRRRFLFANNIHKEVLWQNPKYINSNSLTEFFQTIRYDPANPNIEKTLTCL